MSSSESEDEDLSPRRQRMRSNKEYREYTREYRRLTSDLIVELSDQEQRTIVSQVACININLESNALLVLKDI